MERAQIRIKTQFFLQQLKLYITEYFLKNCAWILHENYIFQTQLNRKQKEKGLLKSILKS